MSILIALAVYSTEENKKDECLQQTLESLKNTVDYDRHKIRLSVNAYTQRTLNIIEHYQNIGVVDMVITNPVNIGTAEAINKVWRSRQPGQHCLKMDDDVVIESPGWLDLLEECIARDPNIGIIGLKRTDCWENTKHEDPYYRSELIQLPHEPGQRWLTIEKVSHVIGTCQLYNSALLDQMGYLFQPCLYGYDDVLAAWRSYKAGFKNCFYPSVLIHHIDPGNTPYQDWKHKHSGEVTQKVIDIKNEYLSGARSIYYSPFQ